MGTPRAFALAGVLALCLVVSLGSCHGYTGAQNVPDGMKKQYNVLAEAHGRKKEVHNPLELFLVGNARVEEGAAVRVWTNATELTRSGTWVDVFWSNVSGPRLDDLVALYVPADADPRKTAPVKFTYAFRSPTHRRIGAGHLRWAPG
jgi:hypothetical protein